MGQTGEAFLFFLTFSFIKKGKKRYNQTTKGTEQSQYTDEYRNNFESCHNNAPPFLCIPVNWSIGSGGYHPVMGTLPRVTTQYYYNSMDYDLQLKIEQMFVWMFA